MTAAVAITNLVLGFAYTGYGVLTAIEMKREWRTMGFSHFGAAWIFMAFTCGPHHLAHGVHAAFEGRTGGGLDLLAVAIGLPVGIIWLLLRIEAFSGGRGDRFISGTPVWLMAMPTVAVVYLMVLISRASAVSHGNLHLFRSAIAPNILLLGIYTMIGYFLLRTQLRTHGEAGGWSVSGLSLSAVFPTCALMHIMWAFYIGTGLYAFDIHGFVIDWLSVPAGLYFLWVVRALYRDSLDDWNRATIQESGVTALAS
jgi:hypothetical protein